MGIYFIVGGHYSSVARPPSFRPPMDNVAMQLQKMQVRYGGDCLHCEVECYSRNFFWLNKNIRSSIKYYNCNILLGTLKFTACL